MTRTRLSYEASCQRLQPAHLDEGEVPPMPARRPAYDDEAALGVSFFRTQVEGDDLSNLTLPRTFFGRSEINAVSFENTDLSESTLCWNDFIGVNFDDADLHQSDLRASQYDNCSFRRADLRGADLRQSTFDGCRFDDAQLDGALVTPDQVVAMGLTPVQRAAATWCEDEGEEPGGG